MGIYSAVHTDLPLYLQISAMGPSWTSLLHSYKTWVPSVRSLSLFYTRQNILAKVSYSVQLQENFEDAFKRDIPTANKYKFQLFRGEKLRFFFSWWFDFGLYFFQHTQKTVVSLWHRLTILMPRGKYRLEWNKRYTWEKLSKSYDQLYLDIVHNFIFISHSFRKKFQTTTLSCLSEKNCWRQDVKS